MLRSESPYERERHTENSLVALGIHVQKQLLTCKHGEENDSDNNGRTGLTASWQYSTLCYLHNQARDI